MTVIVTFNSEIYELVRTSETYTLYVKYEYVIILNVCHCTTKYIYSSNGMSNCCRCAAVPFVGYIALRLTVSSRGLCNMLERLGSCVSRMCLCGHKVRSESVYA